MITALRGENAGENAVVQGKRNESDGSHPALAL